MSAVSFVSDFFFFTTSTPSFSAHTGNEQLSISFRDWSIANCDRDARKGRPEVDAGSEYLLILFNSFIFIQSALFKGLFYVEITKPLIICITLYRLTFFFFFVNRCCLLAFCVFWYHYYRRHHHRLTTWCSCWRRQGGHQRFPARDAADEGVGDVAAVVVPGVGVGVVLHAVFVAAGVVGFAGAPLGELHGRPVAPLVAWHTESTLD